MARQDLSPNQAIFFLFDACTALETLKTLPDEQISAGAKILIDLVAHGVCSCAVVLDDAIDVEAEGGN
ncbi:hypothetical protein [Maridesulfovibrio ferrireducens]|uniref:hypothetical protein n=1 Tax=Maridesulfovibrio ferrireducens TaxID=246191 RepID=UPI001A1D9047|nr:hypothetical protein [Maridesulfovibrio ferrireducens]MBI9109888.1 hypothetical protein [Maridesulfovibrio ferrireducens]